MAKKVTLKDIAEESGLSISTVSRALTRTGKISKENEKKIFESAQRLNYPLSTLETPLELRNTINIAFITRHYTGEFFASLFEGFDKSTKGSKARVNLISVSHSSGLPKEVAMTIDTNHYDAAIIFFPDYRADDYMAFLKKIPDEFPVVSIAPIANPVMDTVTFDNYRGGYLVAKHFEEIGFKKLGIIEGPTNKSEAMLRKNGFVDYIRASDDMHLVWEFSGDYTIDKGKDAYDFFKKSIVKPEAIFCSNDGMTIGFIHEAIRDGLSIPNDVALVGFDNLPTCEIYTPSITSVNTDYELLGKKTLELIFNRLNNKSKPNHLGYISLIPVSIAVRESSTEVTSPFNHQSTKLV